MSLNRQSLTKLAICQLIDAQTPQQKQAGLGILKAAGWWWGGRTDMKPVSPAAKNPKRIMPVQAGQAYDFSKWGNNKHQLRDLHTQLSGSLRERQRAQEAAAAGRNYQMQLPQGEWDLTNLDFDSTGTALHQLTAAYPWLAEQQPTVAPTPADPSLRPNADGTLNPIQQPGPTPAPPPMRSILENPVTPDSGPLNVEDSPAAGDWDQAGYDELRGKYLEQTRQRRAALQKQLEDIRSQINALGPDPDQKPNLYSDVGAWLPSATRRLQTQSEPLTL